MKNKTETGSSDHFQKQRKPKSRQVSSRFLSQSLKESETPSLNQSSSPIVHRKTKSTESKKQNRSTEGTEFLGGLWPSSTTTTSLNKEPGTLADHLDNDRLNDVFEGKINVRYSNIKSVEKDSTYLNRQQSCTEFNRFEKEKRSLKENHLASVGGSMRYSGNVRFWDKSSSCASSSSSASTYSSATLVPPRFSLGENVQSQRIFTRKSDSFTDFLSSESESFSSSTSSFSRKSSREISSIFLNNLSMKSHQGISDSNTQIPEHSPKLGKFSAKNKMKRANSHHGYATSQWALSPGRSNSPPVSHEKKGKLIFLSSLRPPTSSPSRGKSMGNFLSLGLELLKSNKKSPRSSFENVVPNNAEAVHTLRVLHNRMIQLRYANARADLVNVNLANQAEGNLLYVMGSIAKLRHSVLQKKLQLQKEILQMKLSFLLTSQIKPLEAWGDMERQHLLAVSRTRDYLHSAVCKVPLIEGAMVDLQSASIALRHSSDLNASIKSLLTMFSLSASRTVSVLSELAEVVGEEKTLLEECFELLKIISPLEVQESSLQCSIIQLKQQYQQHQHQQKK